MENKLLLYDVFQAYYDARKNKRNTINQLAFELHLEENIIHLYNDLCTGKYTVGKSIYFIQHHPVKREIFAGNFRDRVVHHLVYNAIAPIFEKKFIYDSYSCRKSKGTHLGVKRIKKFLRSCSDNYTQDTYILKLDISGYFMSMNKDILFHKIQYVLSHKKSQLPYEYDFIISLIHQIIYNDPTKHGIFKGKRSDYLGLPKNKSLFFAKYQCGLPIGNLTSQLFSNIYLSDFDIFIKKELAIKYYGRYVDDFILVHRDKDYLIKCIARIENYLSCELGLTLHPKKIYLQHVTKGVVFVGVMIRPYRTYIRKRTLGYFYQKICMLNKKIQEKNGTIDVKERQEFLSIVNSYLGFLYHHKSYKIRKKILTQNIHPSFWKYFFIDQDFKKVKKKLLKKQ